MQSLHAISVCEGIDHTIHFGGRNLYFSDKTTTVSGKDREEKAKYVVTLPVGPLERVGDNMNMGWLPLLDYGEPEGVAQAG